MAPFFELVSVVGDVVKGKAAKMLLNFWFGDVDRNAETPTVLKNIYVAVTKMSTVDTVFKHVQAITEDGKVDLNDWPAITALAMKSVQALGLPGAEKKKIVEDVLKKIIDGSKLSETEKELANTFIEFTLSPLIDVLKAASRGVYKLVGGRCCF